MSAVFKGRRIKRKKAAKASTVQTMERRTNAIERSIQDPINELLKHATSKAQRKLIERDHVAPVSPLKRRHQMQSYDFDRCVTRLLKKGSVKLMGHRVLGNVVLWANECPFDDIDTIPPLEDERLGKAAVS